MDELSFQARVLVAGQGQGPALLLPEPLSLWGGLDPHSGAIIDQRHPSCGQLVTDKVLVLPYGRGSSSASNILLEAVRLHTAPAAIVMHSVDPIMALGAVVAREMYGMAPPVVVLSEDDYAKLAEFLSEQGGVVSVSQDGRISLIG